MGQMKNYRQLLKELPSNKVVLAFGQFQPPTAMHELHIKVVKKLAEEQKSDYVIYASKDLKEELLPADKKVQYMNLMFPNTNIKCTDASSIVEAAKELNKRYKNIVVVTSSDLKEDYDKILNKKNKVDFFFETIEVIAAGNKDPEDNKLRESAKKGDYVKFKTGLPSALREIDSRRLMNDMRQGLGLDMVKEEIKLVKDDLREQYFSGKIFNLGDIVESNGTQYEIVKRGSNHLLLKEESGALVSKWIQDVTLVKEGVIQQSGTDDLDPPTVDTNSTYNIAKDVMRYKDFKKLNAMAKGKIKEQAHSDVDIEGQEEAGEKDPRRETGHTLGGRDDQHRRRKVKYHLGEDFSDDEQEIIAELSSDLLARYKKAAGEQASAADKAGDYEKGNKRFKGINKATMKQFDNDLKKEEVEPIEEISQKLAGDYYGAATKKHIDKVGVKPNMYDRIEKDMGKKRKEGIDRAFARLTKEEVELEEAKKKKEKESSEFKPSAVEVKIKDDGQQVGATNAHGFDAFFNEEEEYSEEEIDKMIADMPEDDFMDAYDDHELAVIDDETGEELEDKKDVKEEAILEVLSRMERIRARVRFAKTKSKRENKVKLALRRTSSSETINKRARRLAINLMKSRLLRGRSMASLSVGEKERIETIVQKRKPILNRIAMKLTSRVRQIEKARLQHHRFTQNSPTGQL
jgi:hypothetical protein